MELSGNYVIRSQAV